MGSWRYWAEYIEFDRMAWSKEFRAWNPVEGLPPQRWVGQIQRCPFPGADAWEES